MRLFFVVFICAVLASLPGRADQTDPRLDELFSRLQTAEDYDAEAIAARIFEIWAEAPSDTTTLLHARAEAALAAGDAGTAVQLLSYVRNLSPHFAEGHKLMAEAQLRLDAMDAAISSLERAVALEPRHFAAFETLGETLYALGQEEAAYNAFLRALRLNPHLVLAKDRVRVLRPQFEGQGI